MREEKTENMDRRFERATLFWEQSLRMDFIRSLELAMMWRATSLRLQLPSSPTSDWKAVTSLVSTPVAAELELDARDYELMNLSDEMAETRVLQQKFREPSLSDLVPPAEARRHLRVALVLEYVDACERRGPRRTNSRIDVSLWTSDAQKSHFCPPKIAYYISNV